MEQSKQPRLDPRKRSETRTTSGIRTTKIEFAGQKNALPTAPPPVRHSSGSRGSTDYARFLDRPDIYLALEQRKK